MRAKKAKKPPRSIRYMLSADRRLQKLSLRKMTERLKTTKPPRSVRAHHAVPTPPSAPRPWAKGWRAVAAAAICVVGAVLIIAGQPSDPGDAPRAVTTSVVPPLDTMEPVVSKAPATMAPSRKPAAAAPAAKTRAIEPVKAPTPAPAPAEPPPAEPPPAEPAPRPAALESTTPQADVPNVSPVTITGCLELDGDAFSLTDTSGAGAPKSRSWRTGFLKKRPARIALVDASNTLRLPGYVGQRVAATGVLTNREMQARSLRRVASSCD